MYIKKNSARNDKVTTNKKLARLEQICYIFAR